MDFSDTLEEAKFRAEVKGWLAENAPTRGELEPLDLVAQAKLWQKRKFDAGWACIAWPSQFGGRDASPIEEVIWQQEESRYPHLNFSLTFSVGLGLVGPTLMTWADDAAKSRFLKPLASGAEIWCQLFSEPVAGSDLAGLRTKALQDGDDWVVNGQKVWTSGAQHSDFGILLARTDATVPKHQGLTYFFVDMQSPGIEVRPIKQINGQSHFNEVFFADVRVSDSQRLGKVGEGWKVALTTLMNERAAIGRGSETGFESLFALSRRMLIDGEPALNDRSVRARLADWYCDDAGLRNTLMRSLSLLSQGKTPGPEYSIGKLVAASMRQQVTSYAMDLMDLAGLQLGDEDFAFPESYLDVPSARIAGGTDEILANIIAERVLGMPQEVRTDKGIPFIDIPTGR